MKQKVDSYTYPYKLEHAQEMVKGAMIVSADVTPQGVMLCALEDADEKELETRYFVILQTGQPYENEEGEELHFLGSYQLYATSKPVHLFEIVNF